MWHTFGYSNGEMVIAAKAWSDFGSHIPLIRSFSLGNNWPPEYPIFSGEPIRYHFLFYFLVGFLEKLGLRIDYALNIPSAVSFFMLLSSIYLLAKELFKSRFVATLSVLLFLFNGSFSYLEFFKTHPLSVSTIGDILTSSTFPSFGPYDGKVVSAFWNLNIYTNQRHLALPFSLLIILVFFLLRVRPHTKISWPLVFLGSIFLGVLPFAHSSIFVMAVLVLGMGILLFPALRKTVFLILLLGVFLSIPRILFLGQIASFIPSVVIGFLTEPPVSLASFARYWFMNLGLSSLLIPLGFLLSEKKPRGVLLLFLPLFLVGNLVQFTSEMAGNHKFFNVFLAVGNVFTAFAIYKIWRVRALGKLIATSLILLVTLSGVIDFFAVKNDSAISIDNYPKSPDISWIKNNTPEDSVFLNTSYIYNPASIAGRKIFLGWPYFSWSLGYDTDLRDLEQRTMLSGRSLHDTCALINKHNIAYVVQTSQKDLETDSEFFEKNFARVYNNPETDMTIYSTERCFN